MSNVLWIRVVEAKSLPAVDGSSSDPFVKIVIPDTKSIITRHISRNLNPSWEEEYIFPISNEDDSIVFDVADYNVKCAHSLSHPVGTSLLKNKPIGIATLNVKSLPLNEYQDLWLPLVGAACTETSKLHIQAKRVPDFPLAAPSLRISPFRLHLERKVFYPGEIIKGHVVYLLKTEKKIRSICLRLTGTERTRWTESGVYRQMHNNAKSSRSETYSANYDFLDLDATLLGEATLFPGTHVLPFEVALPMEIPPTFSRDTSAPHISGDLSSIEYSISCCVDIPLKPDPKAIHCPIVITVDYSKHPSFDDGELHRTKKTRGSKVNLDTHGTVFLEAQCDCAAVLGQPVSVKINLKNKADNPIEKIKYFLQWKSAMYGNASVLLARHLSEKIKRGLLKAEYVEGINIAPGEKWEGSITVVPDPTSFHSELPTSSNAEFAAENLFGDDEQNTVGPSVLLSQYSPYYETKWQLVVESFAAGSVELHRPIVFNLLVNPASTTSSGLSEAPAKPPCTPMQLKTMKESDLTKELREMLLKPPHQLEDCKNDPLCCISACLPSDFFQSKSFLALQENKVMEQKLEYPKHM